MATIAGSGRLISILTPANGVFEDLEPSLHTRILKNDFGHPLIDAVRYRFSMSKLLNQIGSIGCGMIWRKIKPRSFNTDILLKLRPNKGAGTEPV